MSILDKARAGENQLERLVNMIPGFKGYRDKELRRDADRVEREHIASQLEEVKKPLNLLASATGPGACDELPFVWPESLARARNASRDLPPPPIVELLKRKPWLVANLYAGRIPTHPSQS